jgi:heat shock protein HspQ
MPDPVIDPTTGKPVEGDQNNDPAVISIPKEDWEKMQRRLDVFDAQHLNQNRAPAAPPEPSGPTLADQIKEIDKELDSIDDQIDAAMENRTPIKSLLKKRDTLNAKRTRLEIVHEDIEPMRAAGTQTINQLSDQMTRKNMPYYDLVKNDYEGIISALPTEQQMQPDIRKWAYETAVGRNIGRIQEKEREKILRESSEANNPPDAGKSSRSSNRKSGEIPSARDFLGDGGMAALREKGETADEHYRKRGFKDGWAGYYEHHKAYINETLGIEEEE